MRPASIRVRLTGWYFAIFAMTFAFYAVGILLAMRSSVHAILDDELRTRLEGVRRFMERHDPSVSLEDMQYEFREHSGMRPGGDLLQVSDAQGKWLYRSASIRDYQIELPSVDVSTPRYETLDVNGHQLRVLSAAMTVSGLRYTAQLGAPVAEAYNILQRFQWLLIVSIPLVLAAASAGGYWLSRRALAPVDDITRAARLVSEHNLSNRLAIPRAADELQRLTLTFNDMLGRLEGAFKRITQFTADASHELRTPVALVRTAAQLALRRERGDLEYRDSLAQILDEATRMTSLIESLMTLARVDSGAETLNIAPRDITTLVAEACRRSELLAGAKHIQFERVIPDGPILVDADAHALQRLVLILIDNAIKYNSASGRVRVEVESKAEDVIVSVQDTGLGVSEEDLPFIFERFYRADKARSREAGGTGLGLSIAKWIADAHGGSIHVDSTLGKGSTFHFRMARRLVRSSVVRSSSAPNVESRARASEST
jgi:heavy metal sensor kinase